MQCCDAMPLFDCVSDVNLYLELLFPDKVYLECLAVSFKFCSSIYKERQCKSYF